MNWLLCMTIICTEWWALSFYC